MADKDQFAEPDPDKDPRLNDDSQPSVTSVEDVLREADKRAGAVHTGGASIPAPADAIDLAYRTKLADVDADEVADAVVEAVKAGKDPKEIDVEALGEGSPATTKGSARATTKASEK